jgi:hypothetical protein
MGKTVAGNPRPLAGSEREVRAVTSKAKAADSPIVFERKQQGMNSSVMER